MAKITVINNTVEFKNKNSNTWIKIAKGSSQQIVRGDSIRKTTASGSISVVCNNGVSGQDLFTVNQSFRLSDICPINPPQSTPNNAIPVIITPRSTFLISNQPIIRWNNAIGATSYTIQLIDQDANEIWKKDVNSSDVCQGGICETHYSGNSLETNQIYKLIINTNTGRSTQEIAVPNMGFQVIDAARVSEINQKIEDTKSLGLSNTEQALKISEIYEQDNLIAEAILILENLSDTDKTSDIYCKLGQFYYYYLDLTSEGEELLQTAIDKASDEKQLAVAQLELAEVKIIFGQKAEAKTLLEQSLNNYTLLAEQDDIDYVNQKIQQLSP
ncbi:tetratricopeptide repeat protein [Anabaena cylindrica FACHB-243]|uniref:Tetratricopeptide repeat protein n=1 Tax=Anabaena cylindrica (strain ATCC 27899 / PCC 7122) TaxID=272123 RepID=K9ZE82_ANACC|nr:MULTISPECIES: tetratricopeptide repeat protein [Anabaena]AFZ57518.1 hypothetical protein Anacy_2038 [Anabaena cylindrica PCC 7122]MBD2418455.1 tetratricopeptide repeat protein [Anabaena cylindrica FACHB-243]MBY5283666.1 tetratricopeptide repeat protein [Anabaena sp. CCAP 1446/1C]MBY5308442.1 tetratricopeptide repeat protein [Anabaena sp. CCAP 1446/1C]MCM2405118.1 tetratricopeptide repeat protein [Anabaena sp. CCAP 1446/1C]